MVITHPLNKNMNTPTITVHNTKEPRDPSKLNLYCGRSTYGVNGTINAGLGNPFAMKNQSNEERDRVCDEYEKMISEGKSATANAHKQRFERIILRMREGKSIALYCYCSPKRCHCDFIKEYVETNFDFS